MVTTQAVLLRRTRLTETSLIVTWLTLERGRVKTVAKGARRPKSPFAGKLDLFYQCDIQYAESRRSELHTLREASLLHAFENIRRDFRRVQLGAYFNELLDLVTEPEHPVPDLFDLLLRALHHLDAHAATPRALLHFEAETARLLGLPAKPSPAAAIGHVVGRLPSSRKELLGA